jgi:hypothetical protein
VSAYHKWGESARFILFDVQRLRYASPYELAFGREELYVLSYEKRGFFVHDISYI